MLRLDVLLTQAIRFLQPLSGAGCIAYHCLRLCSGCEALANGRDVWARGDTARVCSYVFRKRQVSLADLAFQAFK